MRTVAALAVLTGVVAGCSSHPGTRPLDARRRLTSAEYEITTEGRPLAHVKVWSLGPPVGEDVPDLARRRLEVHLRVRNDTAEPLRLDAEGATLEVRTEHDPLLLIPGPARVSGTPEVPPGGLERVALVFELPTRAHLDEVIGYELLWSLETSAGRFSRSTTFVGERRDEGGYLYYPTTYPFYGLGGMYPWGLGAPIGPGYGFYGYWW